VSIVQELLDRLERQAGEIVALRIERDQLADELRALQAPREPDAAPGFSSGPTDVPVVEPSLQSSECKRRW
jgi:hypothetical protein